MKGCFQVHSKNTLRIFVLQYQHEIANVFMKKIVILYPTAEKYNYLCLIMVEKKIKYKYIFFCKVEDHFLRL